MAIRVGFLKKSKDESLDAGSRRWCELDPAGLTYYKNQADSKPRGRVSSSALTQVFWTPGSCGFELHCDGGAAAAAAAAAAGASQASSVLRTGSAVVEGGVVEDSHIFRFVAEDAGEAEEWADAVRGTVSQRGAGGGRSDCNAGRSGQTEPKGLGLSGPALHA
mgnify:CR=1 FL=1